MDVHDDVLGLVLERVDSHVSLIRAAAVCRRWRRAIADAAFLRRYRSLHAPAVAGDYHNGPSLTTSHGPVFVPSSPPMVDARRFSLDFLPDGVGSWKVQCSRGSLLLLCHADSVVSPVRFRDSIVCEPLTRRYMRIHPVPDLDNTCFRSVLFLIDGESNEAGGRISLNNFRLLRVFDRPDETHAAMYTVGSSWSKKSIDRNFLPFSLMGYARGCWYLVQGRELITLDGSTGDFSSDELPPLEDWDFHTWKHDFFITNSRDGKLRIVTVFDDTMKMFTRLECGKWALERSVMLTEVTCGLPGHEPWFFSCAPFILTIGAGFVILSPRIAKLWPFYINLENMEVAPVAENMGPLLYGCELPWPPTLHVCLDG